MGFLSRRCTERSSAQGIAAPPRPRLRRPARRLAPNAGRLARLAALMLVLGAGIRAAPACAGLPPAFRAPALDGRDRLLAELERTDQVLQRAREHVGGCASEKAKFLLREARGLQSRARELFAIGGETTPAARILTLTRRARELAVDAIEQCQVEFKAHEALRGMLDSTAQLIEQAQQAVEASGNPDARRLLEAGLWQLDRAREAYRAGEYRRAILLGGAARNLLLRALERARGLGDGGAVGSRLETELDRTDALLAEVRATPGWSEDPKARALLEKAERAQEQARELHQDGAHRPALHRTHEARSSALDALWLLQRAPDPARLRSAVEMVARWIDQAAPGIRSSGSYDAQELLDKAVDQLQSAERALIEGDAERAAKGVRTADSLLRRAVEKAAR